MMVAVLGLGSIGRRHAGNLLRAGHRVTGFDPQLPDTEIEGLDGMVRAPSREQALESAQAAVIASPSRFHMDDLAACVNARRHAFVEKPLSHTAAGMAPLLEQAAQAGLVVFPGLNLRFHPAVRAARALLTGGALGRILWARLSAASYLPDWRRGADHRVGYAADPVTGGVLFDIIHEFDLAVHLLGQAEVLACAASSTGEVGINSDDCADVILRHDTGARSVLHLDYVTRPPLRRTEIQGSEGRLCLDIAQRSLTLLSRDGDVIRSEAFDDSFDDDYRAEMAAFVAAIEQGVAPACSADEALAVLQLVISSRIKAGLPGA